MSIVLELSDEIENQLVEYSLIIGLDDDLPGTVQQLLNFAMTESPAIFNDDSARTADQLVNAIINFDASIPVTLSMEHELPETSKTVLTFVDIQELSDGDKLVKKAAELGQLEQLALTDLYNNIPNDLWGTAAAEKLWIRQMEFQGVVK